MPGKDDQTLFRLTLEQMHEGIQILNQNWVYLYLNEAACLHGQNKKDELLGKKMTDLYPGIEKTEMFHRLEYCRDHQVVSHMENEFVYPNGSRRWFELHIEPHHEGILIRSIDITEKKQIQEQLWHSQKLDSIGRMAGNLAHDLHNKFNIILLHCEHALSLSSKPELKKSLDSVLKAVSDSTKLTKQLLAFSRRQVLDLQAINLNDLLQEYEKTLPRLLGNHIQVKFFLGPGLKRVYLDTSQFDQVLLNLCNNARDAMPEGGTLTIETALADLDEHYAQSHPEVTPGEHVLLCISDTGAGMSRDVLSKVFEPFFTTKRRGEGTGLGLPAVQGVVKQCGGHIWLYSEPEVGTTIKIYFPVAGEEYGKEEESARKVRRISPPGKESILLLDDEPTLLKIFENILADAGYKVYACTHPKEARKVFRDQNGKFDLLITDVFLPEINGRQFATELQRSQPLLKVLFLSGYTENAIVHNGILDTENILIQKPITKPTLLSVARQVLDGRITKGVY